jgi:mannosyltransferase
VTSSVQSKPRPTPLSTLEPRPQRGAGGDLLLLGALIVVAAGLRFGTLDVQSFWFDESITAGLVKLNLADMVSAIPHSESTPPLYYVLAWAWTKVFGHGEVGLRSLSALFGTALVPVAYRAGTHLLSRRAGLFAAALVAFNPLLVWYSQEARAYALLVLLCGLSFMFFASFLREQRAASLGWWALCSALALLTHYFALFVVVPEGIWLVAASRVRRHAFLATGAVVLTGLAVLPLALDQRSHGRTGSINAIPFSHRATDLVKQYVAGFRPPAAAIAVPAGLLLLVGLFLLVTRADARERHAATVAGGIGVAAIAVPLVLALGGQDYFITKNLLGAALPITLVPAVGFSVRRAPRLGLAAACAACLASLAIVVAVNTDTNLQRDDWRGAAEGLGPAHGARAIVVSPGTESPAMEIYLPKALTMPPRGSRVSEIDLLDVDGRDFRPQRPAGARLHIPGFRQVQRREAETYLLIRFRARRPAFLTPQRLAAASFPLLRDPGLAALPLLRPVGQRPALRYTDHPKWRPVSKAQLSVMVDR